ALDAQAVGEHRLHVAVETALRLLPRGGDIEAELHLGLDVLQRDLDVGPAHLVARVAGDLVVVAPLVDAHLLREQRDARRRTFGIGRPPWGVSACSCGFALIALKCGRSLPCGASPPMRMDARQQDSAVLRTPRTIARLAVVGACPTDPYGRQWMQMWMFFAPS